MHSHNGCGLRLRLRLLETKSAAILFPFAALLQKVYALKALQHIALGRDLAGTSKTGMLTHFSSPSSKKVRALYQKTAINASEKIYTLISRAHLRNSPFVHLKSQLVATNSNVIASRAVSITITKRIKSTPLP